MRLIIFPFFLIISLNIFGQRTIVKKLYLTQSMPYYGSCGGILSADVLVFTEDTL